MNEIKTGWESKSWFFLLISGVALVWVTWINVKNWTVIMFSQTNATVFLGFLLFLVLILLGGMAGHTVFKDVHILLWIGMGTVVLGLTALADIPNIVAVNIIQFLFFCGIMSVVIGYVRIIQCWWLKKLKELKELKEKKPISR